MDGGRWVDTKRVDGSGKLETHLLQLQLGPAPVVGDGVQAGRQQGPDSSGIHVSISRGSGRQHRGVLLSLAREGEWEKGGLRFNFWC